MTFDAPRPIASFRGSVSCRQDSESPLGLTLVGRTAGEPEELATLTFVTVPLAGLPEALEEVAVEQIDTNRFRLRGGSREWTFPAASFHLHREVSSQFYRAIPPRAVPWGKRLFLRLVLALMGSSTGKRLLLALRRR